MSGKNCFNRTMGVLLFLIVTVHEFGVAQSPISFFPHHVGDLWQYRYDQLGVLAWTERLDSMFVDTSGIRFIRFTIVDHDGNYTLIGWYGIKDSILVFQEQMPWNPPERMQLLYKLDSQLGEVWRVDSSGPRIAQLIDTGTTQIFGRNVHYKDIRYGYLTNSLDTNWWDTRMLSSGFGLTYAQLEPRGPVYLAGAIIDSVQFGFIVSVSESPPLPDVFTLHQNFPNPFNPTTTIRYELPERSYVNLRVYNSLGQEVSRLVHESQAPGTYEVVFNATRLPSGVYFYVLRAGEFRAVRFMVLIK